MGGNFQKVGNSLDFFISETKHRIFNFSGPLRNFPSFGEIGGSGKGPFPPPEASAGVNDVAGEGGWESGRRNARPRWHGIRQNPWSSYRTAWQADHFPQPDPSAGVNDVAEGAVSV